MFLLKRGCNCPILNISERFVSHNFVSGAEFIRKKCIQMIFKGVHGYNFKHIKTCGELRSKKTVNALVVIEVR